MSTQRLRSAIVAACATVAAIAPAALDAGIVEEAIAAGP